MPVSERHERFGNALQLTLEHIIGVLSISCESMGSHLLVSISGGDTPHIGSVVLAEPRPSLTGEGISATSSVLNRIGHKDEAVAREVAEIIASQLNTVTCCVCGIHKDHATPNDINACAHLGKTIAQLLLNEITNSV